MGLSNEERIHKAIWAANRITKIGNKLNPESDDFYNYETRYVVEHLKKLCLEVIPTMSASKGNSLFWIMGADMEVGFSKTTLWSLALYEKIKNAMTPEARKDLKEREKNKEDMWERKFEKKIKDFSNRMDIFQNSSSMSMTFISGVSNLCMLQIDMTTSYLLHTWR